MPMLAVTTISCPSMRNGCARLSGSIAPSVRLRRSPLDRATSRRIRRCRAARPCRFRARPLRCASPVRSSSRSPSVGPMESLTTLKRSMSMLSNAPGFAALAPMHQHLRQPLEQQRAVRQLRQRVVLRLPVDQPLSVLVGGQVHRHRQIAATATALVVDPHARHFFGIRLAGLAALPDLAGPFARLAPDRCASPRRSVRPARRSR